MNGLIYSSHNDFKIREESVRERGSHAWLIACLMIISDCKAIFGPSITNLKYLGIALFVVLVVIRYSMRPINKQSLALAVFGLLLLLVEIPFQTGNFPKLPAVGLYVLVFAAALWSGGLIDNPTDLAKCAMACTLTIGILLLISMPMVREQITSRRLYGIRLRIKGCFSNENSLGNISAVSFALGFCAVQCVGNRNWIRLLRICCLLDAVFCVVSGSRTAIASAIVFVCVWLLHLARSSISDKRAKMVTTLSIVVAIVLIAWLLLPYVLQLLEESGRVVDISMGDNSLFGLGYASSEYISEITNAAGGAVETLFISLYYRLGYIGYAAYGMLLISAYSNRPKFSWASIAIVVMLSCQAIGESYITSVMSFVSLFDWVMLTGLNAKVEQKHNTNTCNVQ